MSDFEPRSPDSYAFWVDETVRYADLDVMGHVNNKAFGTYYESARVAYMMKNGLAVASDEGMALARIEIDYRAEILFPAALRIGLRPLRVGRSSVTLAGAVFNGAVCASTSIAILVRFNTIQRKSMSFTDEQRARLEADL